MECALIGPLHEFITPVHIDHNCPLDPSE